MMQSLAVDIRIRSVKIQIIPIVIFYHKGEPYIKAACQQLTADIGKLTEAD